MSFLTPLWLGVAAMVGVGVVIAHLFSTTLPPRDVLPTVQFIPEEPPLTVLRSRRMSDLPLLVARLLVVAALGLAFAGAHLTRSAPARVLLVDLSRAVGSAGELRDSVRRLQPAVLIGFDSTARPLTSDSLSLASARGSLSSALVAAHRASADEQTELVVVSPFAKEEVDSATATLLGLWQGPVRFVRVYPAPELRSLGWEVRAVGDDPVKAALASFKAGKSVRVVRTAPTASDSLWARDSGGVLVIWPATAAAADSQSGIASAHETVVAPVQRQSRLADGRVVVRWLNGEPAATERALGRGCIRDVAIGLDLVSDLPLRESFRNIARSLVEPCGGSGDFTLAPMPRIEKAVSTAEASVAAGALPLWLALVAAGLLLVEQRLRR